MENSSILHLSDTGNLPNTWFIVLTQRTMNGNRIYDVVTQQAATWFGVHDAVTMIKETAGITEVSEDHQCDFQVPLQSAGLSYFLRYLEINCSSKHKLFTYNCLCEVKHRNHFP